MFPFRDIAFAKPCQGRPRTTLWFGCFHWIATAIRWYTNPLYARIIPDALNDITRLLDSALVTRNAPTFVVTMRESAKLSFLLRRSSTESSSAERKARAVLDVTINIYMSLEAGGNCGCKFDVYFVSRVTTVVVQRKTDCSCRGNKWGCIYDEKVKSIPKSTCSSV